MINDKNIVVGAVIDGKVKNVKDFGIFVEVSRGKDGLVHISTIAREKQRDLAKNLKYGDVLRVKITAIDERTGRIRLVAPELE